MRAVKTNIAITLCWVKVNNGAFVRGSTPKKEVGTRARKKVMMQTTPKDRQRLRFIGWPKK
jgi:hypothetical protein